MNIPNSFSATARAGITLKREIIPLIASIIISSFYRRTNINIIFNCQCTRKVGFMTFIFGISVELLSSVTAENKTRLGDFIFDKINIA